MTVLHTGSTKKFAAGWEGIFGKGKSAVAKPKASAPKKPPKKSSSKRPSTRTKKK